MCHSPQHAAHDITGRLSTDVLSHVPSHPVAKAALDLALSSLPQSILNHSFRVYLYAKAFMSAPAQSPSSPVTSNPVELHVLFAACMLHDISTTEKYDTAPERFEVASADELARLLNDHGIDEFSVREAWLAITLHTTPGVAERLSGAAGSLRRGIMAEFGATDVPLAQLGDQGMSFIQAQLPRLQIEKDLGDAIVRQASQVRSKAPTVSWSGAMLRAQEENPGWDGANKAFWDCA